MDSDVLSRLKKDGAGLRARVNRFLRERMLKGLAGTFIELRPQKRDVGRAASR